MNNAPVVAVDGPSGVGKGTVCRLLAQQLGWHLLDSGAIYRVVAWLALKEGVSLDDEGNLAKLAEKLPNSLTFKSLPDEELPRVFWQDEDISSDVRSEEMGGKASQVAKWPKVRQSLLASQRAFRRPPGLLADGRDMGTVVFPDADLKIFLQASVEERARRRYNQLKQKEKGVSMQDLLRDIAERDRRDANRKTAPLKAATDAVNVNTDSMGIDQVVGFIGRLIDERISR